MKKKLLNRRGFLSGMGALAAGYTLIAKVPAARGQEALEISKRAAANKAFRPGVAGAPVEPNLKQVDLSCDVFVAGGGLSGIAAALSAARHGMKVVLCQDRSRLGGNASSEVKMHPLGVAPSLTGFREGGIMDELKLECAANNTQNSWEVWDYILYDKVISEKNITLILDAPLFRVETSGDKIKTAWVRCDASWQLYKIDSKIFIDATGDARMAYEAGDDLVRGREPVSTYNESAADYGTPGTSMGSSIMFQARKLDAPNKFVAPKWARKITPEMLKFRRIGAKHFDSFEYGYWWIELGGDTDAITQNERLRFELLAVVLGIWDYVKNSGDFPESANWAIENIGMLPGRRETFRIVPEFVFTQHGIDGDWRSYPDNVCVGGWTLDDHVERGFNDYDKPPNRNIRTTNYYNIPFGCLISKKIKNLMAAGRNAGVSHVALSSTRVMSTCAGMGQAAGTAAAICVETSKTPSEVRNMPGLMKRLQQALLRDDQTIIGVKNEDPLDLARSALVSASASTEGTRPKNVISGQSFEAKGNNASFKDPRPVDNSWIAPIADKPWLELSWGDSPVKISNVQVTLDAGNKTLAITGQAAFRKQMIIGPQPRILKDFDIVGISPDGGQKIIAQIRGNYQRQVRASFEPETLKALRINALESNGDKRAVIMEVRCYA